MVTRISSGRCRTLRARTRRFASSSASRPSCRRCARQRGRAATTSAGKSGRPPSSQNKEGKMLTRVMQSAALTAALALVPATTDAQTTIKIGYLATLSGPAAQLGIDSVDGFKLALQKLGGKLGDVPAEVVVADDQLKPEVGIEQAKRLMERDNAPVIVGT